MSKDGCIIALLSLPALMGLRAVVVRDLWQWFIVPLGVPALGLFQAMGLSMFVAFLVYQPVKDTFEDGDNPAINRVIFSVLVSFMCWGVGYVIQAFGA